MVRVWRRRARRLFVRPAGLARVSILAGTFALVAVLAATWALQADRGARNLDGDVHAPGVETAKSAEADFGSGEVAVSIHLEGLDPLTATLEATPSDDDAAKFLLTLINTGSRSVFVDDFRTGSFLGDRELAAMTEGCDRFVHPGSPGPVVMVCEASRAAHVIGQGDELATPFTLRTGLPGMKAPRSQTYRWTIRVRIVELDASDTAGGWAEVDQRGLDLKGGRVGTANIAISLSS